MNKKEEKINKTTEKAIEEVKAGKTFKFSSLEGYPPFLKAFI